MYIKNQINSDYNEGMNVELMSDLYRPRKDSHYHSSQKPTYKTNNFFKIVNPEKIRISAEQVSEKPQKNNEFRDFVFDTDANHERSATSEPIIKVTKSRSRKEWSKSNNRKYNSANATQNADHINLNFNPENLNI